MAKVVLDASALLAIVLDEFAGKHIDALDDIVVDGAIISAVNFTEVRTKLIDLNRLDDDSLKKLSLLGLKIEPFKESQSILAANLRSTTRHLGLSLGDRACLALALETGLEVYTCDQAWSKLTVGCQIHQLR